MNYTTDRKENSRKHLALTIAVAAHLALGIGLYLAADNAPSKESKASKIQTNSQPKAVLQP